MQHFTKFVNETDYLDYIDDTPILCQLPNVSTIVNSTDVRYIPRDYSKEYLTLKFMGENTLSFAGLNNNVISYSDDKGETWKTVNSGTSISTEKGMTLWFKGNLSPNKSFSFVTSNATSNGFLLSGNIMSLHFGDNFEGHTESIYCEYMFSGTSCISAVNLILPSLNISHSSAYQQMFAHCRILKYSPKILPATTLSPSCYQHMFYWCSNLKTAPILPATTLASDCYHDMFMNCASLVTAPELPATTLAARCYFQMFTSCDSLVNAPKLPAMNLTSECYLGMFSGCVNLETAPELPATTLAPSCYISMFANTPLVSPPELPATLLATSCYMRMFSDCSSLEKAPDLLAKTLVEDCYNEMFNGCSSLEFIRCYATNATVEESYLYYWVQNVSNTGTFVKLSGATWYDGNNGIPDGWTIEEEADPNPPAPGLTMYIDDFDDVMETLVADYGSFSNYMNVYLPNPEGMGGNTYRYTNEVVQYEGNSYYLWENITAENAYPSYALTSTVDYDTLYNNSMEANINNRYQPIEVFVDADLNWQYNAPKDGKLFVLVKIVENS